MNKISPFWIYMGIVSILVIVLVYFQGFVADSKAVFPFAIQGLALAQGRNPSNFNFSNYPGTAGPGGGGPSRGQTVSAAATGLHPIIQHNPALLMGRKFSGNRGGPPDTSFQYIQHY